MNSKTALQHTEDFANTPLGETIMQSLIILCFIIGLSYAIYYAYKNWYKNVDSAVIWIVIIVLPILGALCGYIIFYMWPIFTLMLLFFVLPILIIKKIRKN